MTDDNFFDDNENLSSANEYINKALKSTLDEDTYITLQQSTIRSLDLIPKLKPDGMPDNHNHGIISSRSNTTVFAVLNKCRTASGQKLLALWLQNPLRSKEKINLRLDVVRHLVDNVRLRSLCHDDYLRKVPDLMRIAFKFHRDKCSLNDLMKVYNTCILMREFCASQKSIFDGNLNGEEEYPEAILNLIKWINTSCSNLSEFMKVIEDTIEVDRTDESGEYVVKPQCDENIARISLEISTLCKKAREALKGVAEDIGLEADKSVKLETDPEKGFGFKVTKQNEQAVRGNNTYEQLSTVKKDGYRFTSRQLIRISDKFVSSKEEYKSASKYIINDLTDKANMYDSEVLELSIAITMLDVFVALATSAHQNNYTYPLILDQDAGKIEFERLRHPCVECQPDVDNYIPNDISLNRSEKNFYIITGPNMGGKSTFIKSVAIAVIMSQCGSLVPADEAKVSITEGIFTRIGAGDKQMEGISTFMEEMMDMATINENSNKNSLVIIDELGRGTSTFDGFGLAWAIARKLGQEIGCYGLFATHFLELTELEKEVPTVGNLSVKAFCQGNKLTMLYRVSKGICDESYGINVAEFTKFPPRVIEAAKEKLRQFEEVKGFSSKKELRDFIRDCIADYRKSCPN